MGGISFRPRVGKAMTHTAHLSGLLDSNTISCSLHTNRCLSCGIEKDSRTSFLLAMKSHNLNYKDTLQIRLTELPGPEQNGDHLDVSADGRGFIMASRDEHLFSCALHLDSYSNYGCRVCVLNCHTGDPSLKL